MEEKKKINIFIIDDSFNNEENIVKLMRSSGYAAHTTRIEDDEDLIEALRKKTPDILLYSNGMELISLQDTVQCLEEHASEPVPVLAVNRPGHELDVIEAMRTGARDLTSYDNPSHLEMVMHREIQAHSSIAKLFKLEIAIKETEKRCEALLDSSRDAIAYIHEGMHVYSNHSYLTLFGFDESEDLEGMPILDMVGSDDRDGFKTFLRDNCKSGSCDSDKLKLSLSKSNGTEFKGEMEFSPASIEGEPCIQVIIRTQSDNKDLEKQLAMMSQTDSITGLFNRQYFLDTIEDSASKAKEGKITAAALLIHLDNFDDIKQSVGVVAADQFLNEISRQFEESVAGDDVLAHFEGNTYSIIAFNQTAETIEEYANKISKASRDFIANIKTQSLNTTCTIGVSLLDKNTPDTGEILLRAERAVEEAGKQGPNTVIVYQPKEGELTQKEIDAKVVTDLKLALKNNRFILNFQPVISLHGDTDERYEVFVRMLDTDGNIIMPNDFLPAADRTGMSIAIDRWVLLTTITTLTKCWKEGKRTLFFVKLAANSLKDTSLMSWLKEQLKKYNVPKNSLIFEVKESVAVTSLKYTAELAKSLQELNCGFALDDFGTGSNPFELLKHIPADYLKLERSFMEELSTSTENQEAVKAITEKAMELNKLTIAQCVQDATSLSVLWGMGINFIQGNFLQEPSPDLDYDFSSMAG
ncbi:MAG: two-component system response regulator [endosymbiont of Galathealinum brachiosum]|uniref:Two-component system response regulator n=1 Tax=endosymbiont of Galathealinum brachiosum TaxID=2200906 RepID=A0A370DJX0_9GAMM|nr:MAG: two-component system response regulator [endosymbiont of Galathealinum brachiosum]